MAKHNFDSFFESYLDIDSWAENLIEEEHEVQIRRKKGFSKKSQKKQMARNNDNNKRLSRKNDGKNITRKTRYTKRH